MKTEKKYAIFALVRGYKGVHKWKYAQLVLRNLALRRWARKSKYSGDFLLFHEGNISKWDQFAIRALTLPTLRFIDISESWTPHESHEWSGQSDFPLSYSLMCKFNYFDCWKYLYDYEVVCRVDEDCIVRGLPSFEFEGPLLTGALFQETHPRTNASFPLFLAQRGLKKYYDHEFPYTNLYLTKMPFWRQDEVQTFLNQVISDSRALDLRWGDLPVIGVAIKAFGAWDAKRSVSSEIDYYHLSHLTRVAKGEKENIRTKEVWN